MDYLPADDYWVALSGAIWRGPDPNRWMSAGGIGGSAPMSRLRLSGWACCNSQGRVYQSFTRFWSASCEELCLGALQKMCASCVRPRTARMHGTMCMQLAMIRAICLQDFV
eukprot:318583-Amphidinium_carterae.1